MTKHPIHDFMDVQSCILIRAILKHGKQKPETEDWNTETGIWNLDSGITDIENDEQKNSLQQCLINK